MFGKIVDYAFLADDNSLYAATKYSIDKCLVIPISRPHANDIGLLNLAGFYVVELTPLQRHKAKLLLADAQPLSVASDLAP